MVVQGNVSAADVYASRILQLIQAFPAQQDSILDSVLDNQASSQTPVHGVPALQLALSLRAQLGWSVLLRNSGNAL